MVFKLRVSVTHPTFQATPVTRPKGDMATLQLVDHDCNHWHHGPVRLRGICKGPVITHVCVDVALSGCNGCLTKHGMCWYQLCMLVVTYARGRQVLCGKSKCLYIPVCIFIPAVMPASAQFPVLSKTLHDDELYRVALADKTLRHCGFPGDLSPQY